jgi:hypothetical protein
MANISKDEFGNKIDYSKPVKVDAIAGSIMGSGSAVTGVQ